MLVRKPKSEKETKADRFIRAGAATDNGRPSRDLVPVMMNLDRDLLERLDRRAKSMGLNRTAFVVNAVAEKLLALGDQS